MPRKVFLSFLGAIPYNETRYYLQPDRSDLSPPLFYVQEPILRAHGVVDEAIIFTTTAALETNYQSRVIKREGREELLPDEGLKALLLQLQKEEILKSFRAQDIPNGYTETEIWQVFQTVFEQLHEGDQIIFDITFGFRSLPMLVVVLLNYARALKNITIEAIYYGNFEAGRSEKDDLLNSAINEAEKKRIKTQVIEAPVLDLRAFAVLQEWTHAAQSMEDGNMAALARIMDDTQTDFSNSIMALAESIQTCRGLALARDLEIDQLKKMVTGMAEKSDITTQLRPLLGKITKKLEPFQSRQLSNGFAAVEWCLQHGMVQQGITFLQETLQSYVIEQVAGKEFITNRAYRTAANGALYGFNSPNMTIKVKNEMGLPLSDEDVVELYQEMYNLVRQHDFLSDTYRQLSGDFRNDINHCGFRDDYKSPADLKNELQIFFTSVQSLNL